MMQSIPCTARPQRGRVPIVKAVGTREVSGAGTSNAPTRSGKKGGSWDCDSPSEIGDPPPRDNETGSGTRIS